MRDLTFTQDYVVCPTKKQRIYPIIEADWVRLKRIIKEIIPPTMGYQIAWSIDIGIFSSGIFALIAFYNGTNGLASWILPTMWSIIAISFLLGIALILFDRLQKKYTLTSTNTVLEEMKAIESKYYIPDIERPAASESVEGQAQVAPSSTGDQ